MGKMGVLAVLTSVLAGASLGGCSKVDTAKATSGGADTPATASAAVKVAEPDSAFLAEVKQRVEAAYQGNERTPPTDGKKPDKGKNVWIISPGMIGESSSIPVNAAKEAGTAVGWKMTVFDGKLDPSSYSAGIRQAIAAKADGIILGGDRLRGDQAGADRGARRQGEDRRLLRARLRRPELRRRRQAAWTAWSTTAMQFGRLRHAHACSLAR